MVEVMVKKICGGARVMWSQKSWSMVGSLQKSECNESFKNYTILLPIISGIRRPKSFLHKCMFQGPQAKTGVVGLRISESAKRHGVLSDRGLARYDMEHSTGREGARRFDIAWCDNIKSFFQCWSYHRSRRCRPREAIMLRIECSGL